MPKAFPKTKLSPERSFGLSHILSNSESGHDDLQRLNDSVIKTIDLYNKDLTEQLTSLVSVEHELADKLENVKEVYDVVHNIRSEDISDAQILELEDQASDKQTKKKSLGLGMSMFGVNKDENNKFQTFKKIDDTLVELVENSAVQKRRLDEMITRLQRLELSINKRERLFDDKSSNKVHYENLFNYGMKILKKQNRREQTKATTKTSIKSISPSQKSTPKKSQVKSDFASPRSKIPTEKLEQYQEIEKELITKKIEQARNSITINSSSTNTSICNLRGNMISKDVSNPILFMIGRRDPLPACTITDEVITTKPGYGTSSLGNDNCNPSDESVDALVDELKKIVHVD